MSETSGESEPPIREFADRGTLWLLEAPENLRGLVEIVAKTLADKLDFARAERINRSFIPDTLHKQEADLLYRVPYRDSKGEVWIYVLLEHQSKPDKTMGLRLLSYMVELWMTQVRQYRDEQKPVSQWQLLPIIPLVFYTGKRKWKSGIDLQAMMRVPAELERFIPSWETLFFNLKETPSEELAEAQSAMGQVLRVLQVADAPQAELERVLREAATALEAIFASSPAQWQRALQYLFLLLHHKREPNEEAELREELVESIERVMGSQEGERMARTSAQILMAQGRKEGKQEGRIELLLAQAEFKFGTLSSEQQDRIKQLFANQVDAVGLRLLNAQTWDDLGL